MIKLGFFSVVTIVLVFTLIPNVYAEEENGFLQSIQDWFASLFSDKSEDGIIDETMEKQTTKQQTIPMKNAVLIDQLDHDYPNPILQDTITDYFESAGYELDIFTTNQITVDFFKQLPSKDYDFIVIRAHGLAIFNENPSAWIFTGEKYTEDKYTGDQLSGHVSRGVPFLISAANDLGFEEAAKHRYFMIGSKLINDKMEGGFNGSVVILAGCDTLALPELGNAFVNRGASEVVGWNGLIDSYNNDVVLRNLLMQTLLFDNGVQEAVQIVNEESEHVIPGDVQLKYFSNGAMPDINPQL